ncbi:MAG: sulfite exporter TauE/SafE family protein [Crocinitomicaceae bacterium]|nr:sulfite exporter TauE/SafE family protein [Crocinitomicaceae bacterium]
MIWSAFILGLLGSWHCVGMCGPIALMVPGAKGKNRWVAIGLYHGGKILAYMLIGAFFGLFTAFITSFKIQAIITISVGAVIGILAFTPAVINYLEKKGFTAFNSVINFKNKLAHSLDKEKLEYGFYIGFFNGFIPCGLVYIAALGAMVQGSIITSAGYMALFGLGTIPFLSVIIYASSYIKKKFSRYTPRIRFAAFLLVSIFMIWKGISNLNVAIEQPKEGENFQICHT